MSHELGARVIAPYSMTSEQDCPTPGHVLRLGSNQETHVIDITLF